MWSEWRRWVWRRTDGGGGGGAAALLPFPMAGAERLAVQSDYWGAVHDHGAPFSRPTRTCMHHSIYNFSIGRHSRNLMLVVSTLVRRAVH